MAKYFYTTTPTTVDEMVLWEFIVKFRYAFKWEYFFTERCHINGRNTLLYYQKNGLKMT